MTATLNEQTLTVMGLSNLLRQTTKTQKISVTHRKVMDMYKKSNPFYGRVEVVQTIKGQINVDYSRTKADAGLGTVGKRSWGTRVQGTPLVIYGERYYLELRPEGTAGKALYFLDGLPITGKTEIEEFLSHRKPSKDDIITVRDVPLHQVMALKMGGTVYHVSKG